MNSWRTRIVKHGEADPRSLIPNPLNYREHPEYQKAMMSGILDEVGWIQTVIVNVVTGNLIDGHMRVFQAIDKKEDVVPVTWVELSEEEERMALLTFNPVGMMAKEKRDKLDNVLKMARTNDENVQDLLERVAKRNKINFGDYKYDPKESEEEVDEELQELVSSYGVERGQLWSIPSASNKLPHRLMCGSSDNTLDIQRLLGDHRGVLIATDPPYGVEFGKDNFCPTAKDWGLIEGDTLSGEKLRAWIAGILGLWIPHLTPDAAFYLWSAQMEEGFRVYEGMKDAGVHVQAQIIWSKNTFNLGQADYQWKHEVCWYGFIKGTKHRWYGGRDQTTVWNISKIGNSNYLHPNQKPEELYAVPIRHHTRKEDIVLDPFCGSGTQIVVAENMDRVCYGMEIDPKWVAVALKRLEGIGLRPELVE